MRKCDSCGKLYQENKDVFCPHCGAVAHKQCTHTSSFDSNRYDRGEIYKGNTTQYQNTTYNKGFEPHAQRGNYSYNKPENNESYENKIPQINLPDLKTILSKGKGQNGKPLIGIIVFVVILAFNALTAFINEADIDSWEDASIAYVEEDIDELYAVVDKAEIELVDADGESKTFLLKIRGMAFDESLPADYIRENIYSGVLKSEIISEDTFVEMLICDFSKDIINEESYNDAIENSYNYSGKQFNDGCKYEFTYDFDYGEIVHIAGGVNFYLDDGRYINAELPFSAFSISEDGEITYYTSYADYDTAWNTVFSECLNEQVVNDYTLIGFN